MSVNFAGMKTPLLLAATLLALCPSAVRADTVHFGNYAPGTPLDPGNIHGSLILSTQYEAVAFTTGPEALQITSLDLGLAVNTAPYAGFQVFLAAQSFPDWDTLLSFSTSQEIPVGAENPGRVTFLPDAVFTLQPDTTYWIRLQWDTSNGSVVWVPALDTPNVTSTYSGYALAYGTFSITPDVDRGAYYITAVTAVPEASTSALAIAGIALLVGVAHRVRRRRQAE